jgi:hypothetical protein
MDADSTGLEFGRRFSIAPSFGVNLRLRGGRGDRRGSPRRLTPLLANRQSFSYNSQLVHRRKMNIIRSLTRVWLRYKFCVLVQDPGKFPRGAGCLSGFVSCTLQSFFLAHSFSLNLNR